MSLLRFALLAAAGCGAVLLYVAKLVLERDLGQWGPRLAGRLVRLALVVLPPERRAVRGPEWSAELAAIQRSGSPDGPTGLVFACGIVSAAAWSRVRHSVRYAVRRPTRHRLWHAAIYGYTIFWMVTAPVGMGGPLATPVGIGAGLAGTLVVLTARSAGLRHYVVPCGAGMVCGAALAGDGTPLADALRAAGLAVAAGIVAAAVLRVMTRLLDRDPVVALLTGAGLTVTYVALGGPGSGPLWSQSASRGLRFGIVAVATLVVGGLLSGTRPSRRRSRAAHMVAAVLAVLLVLPGIAVGWLLFLGAYAAFWGFVVGEMRHPRAQEPA